MSQSEDIAPIFKSRETILQLLGSQGYDVSKYQGSSIHEVSVLNQNKQLDMLVENGKQKTWIKYHLNKTLRAQSLNDIIEDLINVEEILSKEDNIIVIIKDEPNESLIKILKNIWEQDKVFITVFNISRLQFNILKHMLVPKHEVLNEEESKKFREKYKIISNSKIPDINRFSPVAQAIGIRPGEICKITRDSRTAINTEFYRICR